MNTILLATDGSPSAREATTEAVELAKQTGRLLRVVTVWRTSSVVGYGYTPMAYIPELADDLKEQAGEVARAAVETAAAAGVAATWEVREGNPADEICAVAEESGARLIVIGAHGWGAIQRLVFGSVSTAVLHQARCPVLVVRGEEHELAETGSRAAETVGS